jgi:hypothetical protein
MGPAVGSGFVDGRLETNRGKVEASGGGKEVPLKTGLGKGSLAGRALRQVVLHGLLLISFEEVVKVIQ